MRSFPAFALVVVCAATGCSRCSSPAAPERPPVDRSNGAIPTLTASRAAPGSITIDGKLDEPAWEKAGSTDALVGAGHGRPEPGSNVQGEMKVAWDDKNLYVAAVVKDAAPVSPFNRDDVDPHLWERASAVEVMLQPGDPGDNREYFEIQVDTNGAVWDTRFDDYNRPVGPGPDGTRWYGHQDWSAKLERAAHVDVGNGRYVIEMALPWSALSSSRTPIPPKQGDAWRMNFYSFRDGQRDSLAWSPILGRGNFHFAGRFGRVVFGP